MHGGQEHRYTGIGTTARKQACQLVCMFAPGRGMTEYASEELDMISEVVASTPLIHTTRSLIRAWKVLQCHYASKS